ncbi:MAG: hypothetical protein E1N59_2855 [Puniceicoccaceae bacterium 5H]|nr:MAG: hypothetical protein E1N59_2855 [Puniceicoccaceae bacterium 5H]
MTNKDAFAALMPGSAAILNRLEQLKPSRDQPIPIHPPASVMRGFDCLFDPEPTPHYIDPETVNTDIQ